MSDFASLLRFAQQSSQTPRFNIDPPLGAGSLSRAYQAFHQAQPNTQPAPLFQGHTLPLPPPRIMQPVPLASDASGASEATSFQPQYLLQRPVPFHGTDAGATFQGAGAGKGGPIVKGAGPRANAGSVTGALARIGLLGAP